MQGIMVHFNNKTANNWEAFSAYTESTDLSLEKAQKILFS